MFCSACGAPNDDDASFCKKCGAALTQVSPAPVQVPQAGPVPRVASPVVGKSPIVAAILNLIIGIGYIYLGYRKVLGLPTFLFVVVVLLGEIVLGFFSAGILSIAIAVILAYDGYVKAKGGRGYLGTEPGIGYQP